MAEQPTPDSIRLQLARLAASPEFAGSARLITFLEYVVEETLTHGGGALKEVVIGNAIYERDPPYDSRVDSTVRVEARRLRRKLHNFYRGSGASDPVLIDLPVGGYVPCFANRDPDLCITTEPDDTPDAIFRDGDGAAIAVMPLRAIAQDPDLEIFADSLTDELIYNLGMAEGYWIASRSTVFQFKGKDRSPPELCDLLGVDAVLQGAVKRQGACLRVTIEVSDMEGFVVWSDRFDIPDENPLDFQEKVAKTLLSRVRFDSSKMRQMKIAPRPVAVRANAKIYRARLLLDRQTPDSIANARRLFEQVAESAPDYARGHSGIADCACDLFRLGVIGRDEALNIAAPAVEAALKIDDGSVEANAAKATICAWLERDPPAAEAAYEHARRLGVNARANRLFGVFLSLFGEHEKAARLFLEARDIEPFSTHQDICETVSHYQNRRYAALIGNGELLHPQQHSGEILVCCALAGIFNSTPVSIDRLLPVIRRRCAETPEYVFIDAEIEAWAGDPSRARTLAETDLARGTFFARATLAAALGETERALRALDAALDHGELSTAWMRSDQRFDALRSNATFKNLMGRLKPLRQ